MMAYQQRSGGSGNGISIGSGAAYGAGAFVASYLLTLVLVVVGEDVDALDQDLLDAVGWIFYNSQFVDVTAEAAGESISFNLLSDGGLFGAALELPSIVYRLVPILVLVGAGFFIAKQVGARTTQEGAMAGASIAIGYFTLALLGTFVFSVSEGGASIGPDLVTGALIAGIAYPAIFGAIGGIAGQN